jgi:hypothetical protein
VTRSFITFGTFPIYLTGVTLIGGSVGRQWAHLLSDVLEVNNKRLNESQRDATNQMFGHFSSSLIGDTICRTATPLGEAAHWIGGKSERWTLTLASAYNRL